MSDLRGVILAGGASRRMGRDKAMINHGGSTFLQHAMSLLEAVGASATIVLGRPDLPNGAPDRAPLSGPAAALIDYLSGTSEGSRHLVIPVDMPGLSIAALSHLAAQQDWTYFRNHMLPMLAIGGAMPGMRPKRLRDLLALKKARCLPLQQAHGHWLVNINTPEELHLWRQQAPHEGVSEHV